MPPEPKHVTLSRVPRLLPSLRVAWSGASCRWAFRLVVAAALSAACGPSMPPEDASRIALRTPAAVPADPTLRPAHLVPLRSEGEPRVFGVEPGGGTRMLVSGVRIIKLAGGGVASATDPLPAPPSATVEVPERLGGGFLFAIGPTIYRANKWLAPLERLYASPLPPTKLFVGLDRAYVRLTNNAYAAFDAKTGDPMDLGPWPASPNVTRFVAADGWRAVAIGDLRGAIATFDAGGRWQPLDLPIQARDLARVGDGIVVTGPDADGVTQGYSVEPNGQIAHLPASDLAPHVHKKEAEDAQRAAAKNPLVAAVLDGWPLAGGTALVARDGALSRVRMSDGAVLDTAPDAFALKPAHCSAVSLAPPKSPGAFGFVCGVPHGATEIYAYDAAAGKLVLLRHFDGPRAVFSPSNGTLVVEGSCAADATPVDIEKTEQAYCIMRKNRRFEDFVVNGDVGTERVVPLADGRTAILSPPVGDVSTGRLTLFDGANVKTIPIVFAKGATSPPPRAKGRDDDDEDDGGDAPEDDERIVRAVLGAGTWLRGVEERTPGVLSAWVAHSGRYVGVEVTLAGAAKHGPYVADLGTALVSGRYGLGWTASRQGYETTDGGMTWKPLVLPDPLESSGPAAGSVAHGCGPLGCVLAGWIRVGWGEPAAASADDTTAQTPRTVDVPSPTSLRLRCELAGKTSPPGLDMTATSSGRSYGGYGYGYGYGYGRYYGRYGRYYRQPQTRDWQPFFHIAAPKLGKDELGYSQRVDQLYDRSGSDSSNSGHFTLSAVARLYAWGPKGIDWDSHGHYVVRFTSPFSPSSVLRATQSVVVPDYVADATNFVGLGGYITHPIQNIAFVPADDPDHGLLVVQRYSPSSGNETILVEVEAERPATIVHTDTGEPLGDLESAVRMAGRWYLATSEVGGHASSPTDGRTTIWVVESGTAREIARIPRTGVDSSRPPAVRLARRADGRMLAALVDGPPMPEGDARPTRWEKQTWALPIDVGSGTLAEPEHLGLADGGGKTAGVCGPQDGGWVVDGRWPGGPIRVNGASGSQLSGYSGSGTFARYHVTPTSLCVEQVSINGYAGAAAAGKLGHVDGPFAGAAVFVDHTRQAFRCVDAR
jgi:hypothetical protein